MIHASKSPDANAMKRFNFKPDSLPLGFIIGKAEIVEVKDYTNIRGEFEKDKDKHLATSDWGEKGFILKNADRLKQIIPALGKLNFWEFSGKIK